MLCVCIMRFSPLDFATMHHFFIEYKYVQVQWSQQTIADTKFNSSIILSSNLLISI